VREVIRAVLCGVPRHPTIIELPDPFGWVGQSSATGDSEGGEAAIFDVSVGWLGEGVDIPDEAGFEKLDRFFVVIQLLFVVRFLGGHVLLEAVSAGFRGDDQSIDDGSIGVGREVVTGDCTLDQSGRHLSKGEEMVGGGGRSCGYWSMGSGSKESRYSGT